MWRLSYKQSSRTSLTLSRSGVILGRRKRLSISHHQVHRAAVSFETSSTDLRVSNQKHSSCHRETQQQQRRHLASYPVMVQESESPEASTTSIGRRSTRQELLTSSNDGEERVAIKGLLAAMQASVSQSATTMTINTGIADDDSPGWSAKCLTVEEQTTGWGKPHSGPESSPRLPQAEEPLSELLVDDDTVVTTSETADIPPPPSVNRPETHDRTSSIPAAAHPQATRPSPVHQEVHDRHRRIMDNLTHSLQFGNCKVAVKFWEQARWAQVPPEMFNPEMLRSLFLILTNYHGSGNRGGGAPVHFSDVHAKNPEVAYRILEQYRRLPDANPAVVTEMYTRLCRTIAKITDDTLKTKTSLIRWSRFCKFVATDLRYNLTRQEQEVLYPRFLDALIEQPNPLLGGRAKFVWGYMVQNNFQHHIDVPILVNMIHYCRLRRIHHVPFHEFLKKVVEEGYQLKPEIAINVMSCLFPFTEYDAVLTTMQVLLKLHRQQQQQLMQEGDGAPTVNMDKMTCYIPDMGTLEHIAMAGAQRGQHDVCAAVWDLVEASDGKLGPPTESLFESVAMSFIMAYRQDHSALSVLGEMEQTAGFAPSRALARTLSRSIKYTVRRVDSFYHNLMEQTSEGSVVTTGALNVVMAACAELGEVPRALSVLDDMDRLGLVPNQDSYGFAMEALARGVEKFRKINPNRVESLLREAEFLLDSMEQSGMPIGRHVFHSYMFALCYGEKLDVANQACWDALDAGMDVEDKTLFAVLSFNANRGNLEEAEKLAGAMKEHWGHLDVKFGKWRRRQDWVDDSGENGSGRADEDFRPTLDFDQQQDGGQEVGEVQEEISLREILMRDLHVETKPAHGGEMDKDDDTDSSSELESEILDQSDAHSDEMPESDIHASLSLSLDEENMPGDIHADDESNATSAPHEEHTEDT